MNDLLSFIWVRSSELLDHSRHPYSCRPTDNIRYYHRNFLSSYHCNHLDHPHRHHRHNPGSYIKPDERVPDDVVFLIITAAERQTLHVRLDVRELANGSAQCLVIDDGAFFGGKDCVVVGTFS
jgi:hypothetical protein